MFLRPLLVPLLVVPMLFLPLLVPFLQLLGCFIYLLRHLQHEARGVCGHHLTFLHSKQQSLQLPPSATVMQRVKLAQYYPPYTTNHR